jgi:Arc-like DNA binding domain
VARKLTDTVKLQVRLSERLRRRLEQAAKHNDWSMNREIVNRLDVSFRGEDQEEMIRRATQEAVKSSAGAAVVLELSKLHILPQQPPGKPQLSDEELSHPSADKEEKSK